LQSTDFKAVLNKLLEILSIIVGQETILLDHKITVESSLNMVVASILYDNKLMAELMNFASSANKDVASGKDLILNGVLLCSEEKVRQDFKNAIYTICSHVRSEDIDGLTYVLSILGQNFNKISNRPCREFFDLFNELIDLKATKDQLSSALQAQSAKNDLGYEPETLLTQIIEKFKDNQQNQKLILEVGDDDDEVKKAEQAQEQ